MVKFASSYTSQQSKSETTHSLDILQFYCTIQWNLAVKIIMPTTELHFGHVNQTSKRQYMIEGHIIRIMKTMVIVVLSMLSNSTNNTFQEQKLIFYNFLCIQFGFHL